MGPPYAAGKGLEIPKNIKTSFSPRNFSHDDNMLAQILIAEWWKGGLWPPGSHILLAPCLPAHTTPPPPSHLPGSSFVLSAHGTKVSSLLIVCNYFPKINDHHGRRHCNLVQEGQVSSCKEENRASHKETDRKRQHHDLSGLPASIHQISISS